MIVDTVKGDITLIAEMTNKYDLLIHGCNCFNTMKSGVAAAIARKWPGAVAADMRTQRGDVSKLGSYTTYQAPNGIVIVNAYTQYDYGHTGRYFEYSAFAQVLRELEDDYNAMASLVGPARVLSPKIGSGLGGGDWKVIVGMISNSSLHFTIAEL